MAECEVCGVSCGTCFGLWKAFGALIARCLKIKEKVNIASKASYLYILSGQKFIKDAQSGPFWRVFENLKLAAKHVTRQVSLKKGKNWPKMQKFKYDFLVDFQTLCNLGSFAWPLFISHFQESEK